MIEQPDTSLESPKEISDSFYIAFELWQASGVALYLYILYGLKCRNLSAI